MEIIREALEGARQRILEQIQKAAAAGDAERISQLSIELTQAERMLNTTGQVKKAPSGKKRGRPRSDAVGTSGWLTKVILDHTGEFTREDILTKAGKYEDMFPANAKKPYPSDMERGIPRWHRWVSTCLLDLQGDGKVEKIGAYTYRCIENVKP